MGDTETADDTYVFTDEFASLSVSELAMRDVLDDTDGGVDHLNLTAVTSEFQRGSECRHGDDCRSIRYICRW